MKTIIFVILGLTLTSTLYAWDRNNGNYTKDAYGHYTRNDNLYNDRDGDGTANIYDRNDRSASIW